MRSPASITADKARDPGDVPARLRALPDCHPAPAPTARFDPTANISVKVVAWPDPVIDVLGFDPRSSYVETFWLGIVGPTATWLMRMLVASLDSAPGGFDLHVPLAARRLGVGARPGRNSPLGRALSRCKSFELVREPEDGVLAVRRRIPPLPRRLLIRLPRDLRELHSEWTGARRRREDIGDLRNQARRWALALMDIGEDREAAEVHLHHWRVHPALAHEATEWAWAFRSEAVGSTSERGSV